MYMCIYIQYIPEKCGSNTGMVIYQRIITPTGLSRYITVQVYLATRFTTFS